MNKCIVCGKEYEAKRSTSRYCSAKCRKLAFQTKNAKLTVPVCKNAKPGTLRTKMATRIATVKSSDGTKQDDVRAASERLVAALGEPFEQPKPQSYNPMMVGYVPPKV